MKKALLLVNAVLCITAGTVAQSISYDVATIPENVKKDAISVIRLEETMFEVADLDKAILSIHKVTTILQDQGKGAMTFAVHTSKYASLEDAEFKVFDANGKQIIKVRKKDMSTAADGEGLIEDGYVVYYIGSSPTLPVTVDINYQMKFRGTLFYPDYHILTSHIGIENSSFIAKVPKELDLRYKEKNIALKPVITEDTKYKTYKWAVKNLSPVAYEDGGPDDRYPSVQLAPNRFEYYGYTGDLTSWKSFGSWIGGLYKGLDELSPERKEFFRNLVKDIPGRREKIKAIYTYMQKNFRYVSIQLGIGGLKPFSAAFTDSKKYGDCKALSNFMKAALKAIDINSNVAIINAEYNSIPVDPSFPSNGFDHVILCVPMEKDSIWLECTSNKTDFGILGTFTENRNALLVCDEGGVLVPTPKSKATDNRRITKTTVTLQEDGSGKTSTLFNSCGTFRILMDDLLTEKKDDQKETIVNYIGFKQPDEFAISKNESLGMNAAVLDMDIEKIPEFIAGSKMFINPHIYKMWSRKLPPAQNRTLDYYFHDPFEQVDTTVIKLPAGYIPEAFPKNKELSCPYATYSTVYWHDKEQNAVYSTTKLLLKQHIIPAAGYADVKKFFDEVLLDDTQRIVVKKE